MVDEAHTLRSFDAALSRIDQKFSRMGEQVVGMVQDAIASIADQDRRRALSVVESDLEVDRQFEELRAECFDAILRFQPVARDLRQVISVEHAVGDLERIGDHAKNMAKMVIAAPVPVDVGSDEHLKQLTTLVMASLREVLTAVANRDPSGAHNVVSGDEAIDALNSAIFDRIMVEITDSALASDAKVRLLFTCKALERIGDHSTNIAEEVLFMTRGMPASATRSDISE